MSQHRRLAAITGALYLLTFLTSIPALVLKRNYLDEAGTLVALHSAIWLEIVLALACIGTAVAFYPIGRHASPALALGFVASRLLEATMVFVGVIALLTVASMRTTAGSIVPTIETAMIAVHDWAFLIGPGLLPALNAALFATLLYRARMVPRIIPLIGLIGAPALVFSAAGTIAGAFDQVSPIAGMLALPIALWEFSIGLWLLTRGIAKPTPKNATSSVSLASKREIFYKTEIRKKFTP